MNRKVARYFVWSGMLTALSAVSTLHGSSDPRAHNVSPQAAPHIRLSKTASEPPIDHLELFTGPLMQRKFFASAVPASPQMPNSFAAFPWPGFQTTLSKSSNEAQMNPTTGERSKDLPMLVACTQSTPLVPVRAAISWLAMPTPMIERISVWELEAGRPKYQVPRFQRMAATSRANTMAKPALLPT